MKIGFLGIAEFDEIFSECNIPLFCSIIKIHQFLTRIRDISCYKVKLLELKGI